MDMVEKKCGVSIFYHAVAVLLPVWRFGFVEMYRQ